MTQLGQQLTETRDQLTESSRQLGKEQAKNRSIDKHGQVVEVVIVVAAVVVEEIEVGIAQNQE